MLNHTNIFHEKKIQINPQIIEFSNLKEQEKYYEIWEVANFLYVLLCPELSEKYFWEINEFNNFEHFKEWLNRKNYRIFDEEYIEAILLKKKLLKKYEGVSLEDYFDGQIVDIKGTQCYFLETEQGITPIKIDYDLAKQSILNDLKLIKGIGPYKEKKFKSKKMDTIENLISHEKYGKEAFEVLDYFGTKNYAALADWLGKKTTVAKTHPAVITISQFLENQFVFLDIENLGFPDLPIVLIGIGKVRDNKLIIKQFLVREPEEEVAVLHALMNELNEDNVLVTFNGLSFDVPVINVRLEKKDIIGKITHRHYDLLWFSRRAWKGILPNCRLPTIEKEILKLKRKNDIPSYMVPEFYYEYLESNNIGPLIPIIQHNVTDITTLYDLYKVLKDILI